jgi:hypothetical protein
VEEELKVVLEEACQEVGVSLPPTVSSAVSRFTYSDIQVKF